MNADKENTEIKLLIDACGETPAYEMVPAQQIGPRHYRILASPGFAPGVASGDEIELVPFEKSGYRVVRRSGNICVQLFLKSCGPQDRAGITDIIRAIGGWLDGGKDLKGPGSGCLLIFTIPVSAGFEAIEQAMLRITESFDVDKWMYGNVYDPADGRTPLNWWR
jgi:hypothetical protein